MIKLVDVDALVLRRAAQPMPTELGTLMRFTWRLPCRGRKKPVRRP
jgi:hypothetical protein